jgi:hypothetical protein
MNGWVKPVCGICHEPLRTKDAILSISISKAIRQQLLRDQRSAFIGGRGGDQNKPALVSLDTVAEELIAAPSAFWLWAHEDCTPDENSYAIEGRRINTPEKALIWTFNLQEKAWFDPSAWSGAIGQLFDLNWHV